MSCGNPVFNFLGTYRYHTILHSDQLCKRVLISPRSCQHLICFLGFFFSFKNYNHPSEYEVLCHGFDLHFSGMQMTKDIDHLFMSLLAICVSSLGKCLLKSFAYFLIDLCFC